jgi:hypothetical protein
MSSKFEIWNNRITEATDELSRRKLIGELGMWRAAHLSDIPAMRSSAFGMSRLYMLVGDHASAVREAHSLYSLCQTAPEATREEFKKAKAYLRSLGLTVKDSGELVEREKKAPKNPRKDVVELLGAGKIDAALKLLRNRRGPTSTLFHIWIELTSALKKGSDAESLEAFRQVQEKLTSHLHLDKKPATKVKNRATFCG